MRSTFKEMIEGYEEPQGVSIGFDTLMKNVMKLRSDNTAKMRDIIALKKLIQTWLVEESACASTVSRNLGSIHYRYRIAQA